MNYTIFILATIALAYLHTCLSDNKGDLQSLTDDDILMAERRPGKIQFTNTNAIFDYKDDFQEGVQWPRGEIPFIVEEERDAMDIEKFFEPFSEAVEDFHQSTCVRFRPKRDDDESFIRIFRDGNG